MTLDASSAYRRTDGHTANPVRLIIMMYEQLIKDLQRVTAAMQKQDIEGRAKEIDHALVVVGQLQGSLDMERGGEVAKNLDNYYYTVRATLLEAQFNGSTVELRRQIQLLLDLREAWIQVERSLLGPTDSAMPGNPLTQAPSDGSLRWSI